MVHTRQGDIVRKWDETVVIVKSFKWGYFKNIAEEYEAVQVMSARD